MPILNVKLSSPASVALSRKVADTLSALSTRLLGKDPRVTSIAIDFVSPAHWYVGGRPLSEQGVESFFFDIRITDETNTKAEKAAFVAEAYAALCQLLGPVHEESYIHVHDVRAASYGYGGRTQEWRYQHPAA